MSSFALIEKFLRTLGFHTSLTEVTQMVSAYPPQLTFSTFPFHKFSRLDHALKQGSAFGSGGPKPDRAARFYPDRALGSGREFQNLGMSGWISADRAARNFRDIPIFSPIKKVFKLFEASKNFNS